MPQLADFDHIWGSDIAMTPTGDISVVTTRQRTVQRIVRRLMTAPTTSDQSDYPWEPDYGVGLGDKVGDALDVRAIQGVVRSQLLKEAAVARIPAPVISVTTLDTGLNVIDIRYTDLSGAAQNFTFSLASPSASVATAYVPPTSGG